MATHRNSRSPLVINIARLGRRPGSMITFNETVPSPRRIGLELVAIPEGAPLELDLRIESVSEGALVTGTMSAPTTGECARCLTPVTGHVEIDLTELFAYPDSATEATTDADEVGHVVKDSDRPRAADRRRRRSCAAVLAAVRSGLPRAVPGLRRRRWRPRSPATITRRSIRVGRSSPRCWRPTTSDGRPRRTRGGSRGRSPRRAAHHGADASQLLLRERRPADQRAAGIPRRRRPRADDHRGALSPAPRPLRGRSGQAACQHRQHPGACRRRPHSVRRRSRRAPASG